jgi:hypothetical protein
MSPWKAYSVGEEMLAADFTTYVGNQVVATFDDGTQRTAQLAAPIKGQLSTLDDHLGQLDIWTGSLWQPVTPYIQNGQTVVTTDANGLATITYPTPFASPPTTVLLQDMGASAGGLSVSMAVIFSGILAASVQFQCRIQTGALINTGNVRVGWVAVGIRAAG